MRRVLAVVGKILIGAGVLLLLFTAYQIWGTAIQEGHTQSALRNTLVKETNNEKIRKALTDAATLKLCRLRYVGSASQWQFAIYRASHDDYDESVFFTGLPVGTCQDALDTACGLYLNDPTAWT